MYLATEKAGTEITGEASAVCWALSRCVRVILIAMPLHIVEEFCLLEFELRMNIG